MATSDRHTQRIASLHSYVVALITEGMFAASEPVEVILRKVGLAMKEDLREVLEDIGRSMVHAGADRLMNIGFAAAKDFMDGFIKQRVKQ